jgi:hydroxymethylpyrimidine/phosphomethylpyrimidine kinase
MTHPLPPSTNEASGHAPEAPLTLPCVMVFNANDPSGAGGLAADLTTIASASGYGLPVVTGTYIRDTSEIRDHIAFDEEAVEEQARCALEDVNVVAFKVGFLGSPDNVGAVSEIASDYPEIPLVAYMSDLSWWDDLSRDTYLDAVEELLLPQTTVLVGNHSSLCRWLLPEWEADKPPGPRDVARAAAEHGVSYTLVTGFNAADQYLESHLATPETVLATARYERFEATFTGAGDTLSAALAALLAAGADLQTAVAEALTYLDQCLDAGFQPGMGHAVPDRLFWAHDDDDEPAEGDTDDTPGTLDFPLDNTRH